MKIFVPIDGSERSLNAIQYVLSRPTFFGEKPEVCLFLALEHASSRILCASSDKSMEAFYQQEAQYVFDAIKEKLGHLLDGVYFEYGVGPIVETIVKAEDDFQADFVVMGAHGRGRLSGLLFGSTAQEVISGSRRPILMLRDVVPTTKPMRHIAIAVDNTNQSLPILGFLQKYCQRFASDAVFDLIHVDSCPEEDKDAVAQGHAFAVGSVGESLENALQDAGKQIKVVKLYGEPGEAIANYVEKNQVDLVIMGTHGYSMFVASLIGSTALSVTAHCGTPLVLVR